MLCLVEQEFFCDSFQIEKVILFKNKLAVPNIDIDIVDQVCKKLDRSILTCLLKSSKTYLKEIRGVWNQKIESCETSTFLRTALYCFCCDCYSLSTEPLGLLEGMTVLLPYIIIELGLNAIFGYHSAMVLYLIVSHNLGSCPFG